MRFQFALLQRQSKIVQTRDGACEVCAWYIGKELATGLYSDNTLEEAIEYAQEEGWQPVPDEIGQDAVLLKRPRE